MITDLDQEYLERVLECAENADGAACQTIVGLTRLWLLGRRDLEKAQDMCEKRVAQGDALRAAILNGTAGLKAEDRHAAEVVLRRLQGQAAQMGRSSS